jgi:hypothetical protein
VHMIRPQMPFFNLTLLLLGQPTEYFPQIPPQFLVQSLPAAFGMKTTCYLHSHFVWFRLSGSSIVDLLFVCFGGSR